MKRDNIHLVWNCFHNYTSNLKEIWKLNPNFLLWVFRTLYIGCNHLSQTRLKIKIRHIHLRDTKVNWCGGGIFGVIIWKSWIFIMHSYFTEPTSRPRLRSLNYLTCKNSLQKRRPWRWTSHLGLGREQISWSCSWFVWNSHYDLWSFKVYAPSWTLSTWNNSLT